MTKALRRNNVQRSGNGDQTVILLHGFGTDHSSWRRVLPFFERRYRVVRYDMTGVGLSDKSAYERDGRHSTLEGHAQDLLEICAELDLREALFVGHSCGALIGLLAAVREPQRFRRLAFIAGSPCYTNYPDYRGGFDLDEREAIFSALSRDYVAWCEATVPLALASSPDDQLARDLVDDFKQLDGAMAHHLARVIFTADYRDRVPLLKQPVLLVQATHDPFVPLEVAQYLQQRLPDAKLTVLVARGGHFPHLGAPDAVTEALREFLLEN